jgi:carbon monoxide dehydrogenase subunit G
VVTTAPIIDYRGTFRFTAPPATLWEKIERTGEFERWWGWLGDFHLDGPGLEAGSVLIGVVSPPLPYHMSIRVELERCVRPSLIEATVRGDLEGHGRLELNPDGDATVASVAWRIEMMQRPMRAAARFASPLLRFGHDRVVDATVHGFRRQLAASADARRPGPPPTL